MKDEEKYARKFVGRILLPILIGLPLATVGCINISTRLQPEDSTVREELVGEDCVPIIVGIGFGTADVARAMAQGEPVADRTRMSEQVQPIAKVRRVELHDVFFWPIGWRCVEVVGEAARQP